MNKVILLGRLTKEPEIRYSQSTNTMMAQFTLAVNRKYVRPGEERQSDFINIVAWSKTAEFAQKYLHTGLQICVSGRLQVRSYTDKNNQTRYITEVVVEEIDFADAKRNDTNENALNSSTPIPKNTEDNTSEEILNGDDLPF